MHAALHGPDAACHDFVAGAPGAFAAAVAQVAAARAAGEPIAVTTHVTRSGYRVLGDMPALLARLGAAAWNVVVPAGGAGATPATAPDGPAPPRLAMALPFALHALDRAIRLGVAGFVTGAPRCLLGPLGARARTCAPRSYPAPCDGCAARPRCPGLDAGYVARFGAGELVAQRAAVTSDEPGPAALAALLPAE